MADSLYQRLLDESQDNTDSLYWQAASEIETLRNRVAELERDHDSWRRTAERCETEKQSAESQLAALQTGLQDPENVLACMLRGTIAKLSWRSMCSLTGEVLNGEDVQLSEIVRLREELARLQKNHDRWEKIARDERSRCNLLESQLTALQTAIDATGEVHPSWNTSKDFQDGWRECIDHIREDAERPATYFADMRRQLSELREGLEGLQKYVPVTSSWDDGMVVLQETDEADDAFCCVTYGDLRRLLTQTTPTVNSVESKAE